VPGIEEVLADVAAPVLSVSGLDPVSLEHAG
jgi:hypothetical protein